MSKTKPVTAEGAAPAAALANEAVDVIGSEAVSEAGVSVGTDAAAVVVASNAVDVAPLPGDIVEALGADEPVPSYADAEFNARLHFALGIDELIVGAPKEPGWLMAMLMAQLGNPGDPAADQGRAASADADAERADASAKAAREEAAARRKAEKRAAERIEQSRTAYEAALAAVGFDIEAQPWGVDVPGYDVVNAMAAALGGAAILFGGEGRFLHEVAPVAVDGCYDLALNRFTVTKAIRLRPDLPALIIDDIWLIMPDAAPRRITLGMPTRAGGGLGADFSANTLAF